MKLFDNTLTDLSRSLDVRATRHNLLQGNLANIDTPGYVPEDVDFDSAMAALREDEAVTVDEAADQATASLDGNRVDADRTMATLAENAMQYGASSRVASKKLALLRYVASDGVG